MDDKALTELDAENKFPSLRTHLFSYPMDEKNKKYKFECFSYMKGSSKCVKDAEDFIRKFCE